MASRRVLHGVFTVSFFFRKSTFIQNKSEARRAWRARGARAAAVPARRCLPEEVPTLALIPRTSGEDGTVCVWKGVCVTVERWSGRRTPRSRAAVPVSSAIAKSRPKDPLPAVARAQVRFSRLAREGKGARGLKTALS